MIICICEYTFISLLTAHAPEFSKLDKEDMQYGVESHPMTISLHLRGYPPPQVTWYHEGKKLILGDRYDTYVTPTGELTLKIHNWKRHV